MCVSIVWRLPALFESHTVVASNNANAFRKGMQNGRNACDESAMESCRVGDRVLAKELQECFCVYSSIYRHQHQTAWCVADAVGGA